jgi:hypothetical protein
MMLAAVETVTEADAVRVPRRHDADVAAQAPAGEAVHAACPLVGSVDRRSLVDRFGATNLRS